MKIECTEEGEILVQSRIYVHKMICASARRFLKLNVIKFKDHPSSAIKTVREDIKKRFTFDPPLKDGYIMWYIESCMRNTRYEFHRYWLDTGHGEKHEDCHAKFYPALVKYWKTARG